MQKHSEVVHIEIYSMSSNADKSFMKRTFRLTESRPDNKWGETYSNPTRIKLFFMVVGAFRAAFCGISQKQLSMCLCLTTTVPFVVLVDCTAKNMSLTPRRVGSDMYGNSAFTERNMRVMHRPTSLSRGFTVVGK